MPKQEKFTQPWKEFAMRWQKYYTPPGRPSKQAIKVYKRFVIKAIKGVRNPKGLVFGSTPELRDLLAELGLEVTIIDINLEMILAMSELTKRKNLDEIIVKADWLSNPLDSHYYDVVLGDLVLSNIPPKKQPNFLKEIKRLLKQNGHWITKLEVVPNKWKIDDFNKLINEFARIPWHRNRPMESLFLLLNNAWEEKTNIGYLSKVKLWMNKYKVKEGEYKHPDKNITRCLNLNWEMWKPLDKRWSFRRERDTVKQISPYFKIVKKVILGDCYYRQVDESTPIWFCQVR